MFLPSLFFFFFQSVFVVFGGIHNVPDLFISIIGFAHGIRDHLPTARCRHIQLPPFALGHQLISGAASAKALAPKCARRVQWYQMAPIHVKNIMQHVVIFAIVLVIYNFHHLIAKALFDGFCRDIIKIVACMHRNRRRRLACALLLRQFFLHLIVQSLQSSPKGRWLLHKTLRHHIRRANIFDRLVRKRPMAVRHKPSCAATRHIDARMIVPIDFARFQCSKIYGHFAWRASPTCICLIVFRLCCGLIQLHVRSTNCFLLAENFYIIRCFLALVVFCSMLHFNLVELFLREGLTCCANFVRYKTLLPRIKGLELFGAAPFAELHQAIAIAEALIQPESSLHLPLLFDKNRKILLGSSAGAATLG
mmetsp:Transcript_94624/g.152617  ORF Transcript_94624/g.152617 Transcript_94624/m.152617 type:complete len:364 (-) Transcript_94624:1003-2094(-)